MVDCLFHGRGRIAVGVLTNSCAEKHNPTVALLASLSVHLSHASENIQARKNAVSTSPQRNNHTQHEHKLLQHFLVPTPTPSRCMSIHRKAWPSSTNKKTSLTAELGRFRQYVHVEQVPVLNSIQTYTNHVFTLPLVLEGNSFGKESSYA